MKYAKDIKVGDKFYFPHNVFPYNEVNEVIEVKIDPKAGEDVRDMFGGVVSSVPKYSIIYRGTKTQKTGGFVFQDDMSVASNYMKFVDIDECSIVKDKTGNEIHVGDKVVWYDPDKSARDTSIVWEVFYVSEEMVKISYDYGEAEVLPEELKVIAA